MIQNRGYLVELKYSPTRKGKSALFDNIRHDLLMKAVRKHVQHAEQRQGCNYEWVILYIERWLVAPLQKADGTRTEREIGTPQGGVVSPVLANLFLHYVFDKWMEKHYPDNPWCRYADDGLVHARNRNKAEILKRELEARFMGYCAQFTDKFHVNHF